MKYFISVVIMLCSLNVFGQSGLSLHGTMVIAAITNDGNLAIEADSRAVIQDPAGVIHGYYDGVPKIFQCKNIIIGFAGNDNLGERNISFIFKKFCLTQIPDLSTFFQHLNTFAKKNLSAYGYSEFIKNTYIIAGFRNHRALIYEYRHGYMTDSLFSTGFLSNAFFDAVRKKQITDSLKMFGIGMGTEYIEHVITNLIVSPVNNSKGILGGGLAIANIVNGTVAWAIKQNINEYDSFSDFYSAYKKGKITIKYPSKIDSSWVAKTLDYISSQSR